MTDDEMDELLIHAARDYNEPKAVPRDEMWARIADARRAAARDAKREKRGSNRVWTWAGIAVAAAIVLAVGVGIGRRLERTVPGNTPVVATHPTTSPNDAARPATPVGNDTLVPRLREETRNTDRRVRELALAAPGSGKSDSAAEGPNLAYRLVMLRHIAGSEAMITTFRASARHGEIDAQMAAWSRELLGTTRMLEASPVAEDPTMRRLLEDLDLVIVQIARYVTRGTVNTEELDLIEESINKRGVITKLRSSLSARNSPAGT